MAERGNMTFPEVINNFNVYNGANKLVGVSGEVSLAEMQAMTAEVSGAGIMGSYNTAVGRHVPEHVTGNSVPDGKQRIFYPDRCKPTGRDCIAFINPEREQINGWNIEHGPGCAL